MEFTTEGLFEVAIESWPDIYIYMFVLQHYKCIYMANCS